MQSSQLFAPLEGNPPDFDVEEVLEILRPFLSDARARRIGQIVEQRIATVAPVLEGLYDRGNVSAVLRSAEGLGYLRMHIIDSSENFKEANRVTQGAEKWMDLQVWGQTRPCLESLKAAGWQVLATHLDGARDIADVDFARPTAFIFGNEKEGVSREALTLADATVKIPMTGFSQSFNISVAAALFLYHVRESRRGPTGAYGDLNVAEQRKLTAAYYLRSVQHAEASLLDARAACARSL